MAVIPYRSSGGEEEIAGGLIGYAILRGCQDVWPETVIFGKRAQTGCPGTLEVLPEGQAEYLGNIDLIPH